MLVFGFRLVTIVGLLFSSSVWAFTVVNPSAPVCLRSSNLFGTRIGDNAVDGDEDSCLDVKVQALECDNHSSGAAVSSTFAKSLAQRFSQGLMVLATAAIVASAPQAVFADGQTKDFRLPPIDYADKTRCELQSSSIGQANAARDKLYDLRQCKLSGAKASGYDLSGVIMTQTDFSNAKLDEAYFSKGYLRESNFDGADFTNAIVDRATFKGSSLRGAIFKNAVLTGTSFEGADLEGADFTEAALGSYDIRFLCQNPTLKGENPKTGADTRETVGCGPS